MRKSFIRGRIHPKPIENPEYKGMLFSKDDVKNVIELFKNRPVCVQHDQSKIIGRVLRIEQLKDGSLMADLFIDDSLKLGKEVLNGVKSGEYTHLSFSYASVQNSVTQDRIRKFSPLEISVVKKGAIAKSRIECFGEANTIYFSKSGISELYMSDNKETPPTNVEKESILDLIDYAKSHGLNSKSIEGFAKFVEDHDEIIPLIRKSFKSDSERANTDVKKMRGIAEYVKRKHDDFPDTVLADLKEEMSKDQNSTLIRVSASLYDSFTTLEQDYQKAKEMISKLENGKETAAPIQTATERRKPVADILRRNRQEIDEIFKSDVQSLSSARLDSMKN